MPNLASALVIPGTLRAKVAADILRCDPGPISRHRPAVGIEINRDHRPTKTAVFWCREGFDGPCQEMTYGWFDPQVHARCAARLDHEIRAGPSDKLTPRKNSRALPLIVAEASAIEKGGAWSTRDTLIGAHRRRARHPQVGHRGRPGQGRQQASTKGRR
jgi:hypothetical protein